MKQLLIALTCLFCSMTAQADEEIALSIGRTFYWPAPTNGAVSVSNGAVVRVVDQGRLLKITALKIGTSVLRSSDRALEISVVPEASFRIYETLKRTITPMRGLALTLDTGKLHVSGRLLRWDDWRKIAENARGFPPDSFIFSAQIDDDVLNEAKAGLRAVVRDAGMTDLEFRFTPSVSVQVSPTPADLKERTVAVLKGFGIPVRESAEAVHLAPLVRVRIVVAEVRKSAMTKIGISWQDSLGGQLLPTKAWEPFSARLHAMEATGESKILASPTLLCRSGKEAHFLAGGEFPIKVSSLKSHELVWKKHGVVLNIKPQADLSGRMSIGIETEVSMLDTSRTIEGLPGLLTNRIETHFDLTSSRTIALSGLIKKEWGQARQGLPGLGALPILGPLFSSRDYIDSLTELVVFVTPEVVDTEKGN